MHNIELNATQAVHHKYAACANSKAAPTVAATVVPCVETADSPAVSDGFAAYGAQGSTFSRRLQRAVDESTSYATPEEISEAFQQDLRQLCSLWEELGITYSESQPLVDRHFTHPTEFNRWSVREEIKRLVEYRHHTKEVLKLINAREDILGEIHSVVDRYEPSSGTMDYVVPPLLNLLSDFRKATIDCSEAILKWKTTAEQARPSVQGAVCFLWQGMDYSHKQLSDLHFLAISPLAECLPYRIINNPFLDPELGPYHGPPPLDAPSPDGISDGTQASSSSRLPSTNQYDEMDSARQALAAGFAAASNHISDNIVPGVGSERVRCNSRRQSLIRGEIMLERCANHEMNNMKNTMPRCPQANQDVGPLLVQMHVPADMFHVRAFLLLVSSALKVDAWELNILDALPDGVLVLQFGHVQNAIAHRDSFIEAIRTGHPALLPLYIAGVVALHPETLHPLSEAVTFGELVAGRDPSRPTLRWADGVADKTPVNLVHSSPAQYNYYKMLYYSQLYDALERATVSSRQLKSCVLRDLSALLGQMGPWGRTSNISSKSSPSVTHSDSSRSMASYHEFLAQGRRPSALRTKQACCRSVSERGFRTVPLRSRSPNVPRARSTRHPLARSISSLSSSPSYSPSYSDGSASPGLTIGPTRLAFEDSPYLPQLPAGGWVPSGWHRPYWREQVLQDAVWGPADMLRAQNEIYWRHHDAACKIQALVRGWRVRCHPVQPDTKHFDTAAMTVQRVYRGHLGRLQAGWIREQRDLAAIDIQRIIRGAAARRLANRLRKQRAHAALLLQCRWRGVMARRRFQHLRQALHEKTVPAPTPAVVAPLRPGRDPHRTIARGSAATRSGRMGKMPFIGTQRDASNMNRGFAARREETNAAAQRPAGTLHHNDPSATHCSPMAGQSKKMDEDNGKVLDMEPDGETEAARPSTSVNEDSGGTCNNRIQRHGHGDLRPPALKIVVNAEEITSNRRVSTYDSPLSTGASPTSGSSSEEPDKAVLDTDKEMPSDAQLSPDAVQQRTTEETEDPVEPLDDVSTVATLPALPSIQPKPTEPKVPPLLFTTRCDEDTPRKIPDVPCIKVVDVNTEDTGGKDDVPSTTIEEQAPVAAVAEGKDIANAQTAVDAAKADNALSECIQPDATAMPVDGPSATAIPENNVEDTGTVAVEAVAPLEMPNPPASPAVPDHTLVNSQSVTLSPEDIECAALIIQCACRELLERQGVEVMRKAKKDRDAVQPPPEGLGGAASHAGAVAAVAKAVHFSDGSSPGSRQQPKQPVIFATPEPPKDSMPQSLLDPPAEKLGDTDGVCADMVQLLPEVADGEGRGSTAAESPITTPTSKGLMNSGDSQSLGSPVKEIVEGETLADAVKPEVIGGAALRAWAAVGLDPLRFQPAAALEDPRKDSFPERTDSVYVHASPSMQALHTDDLGGTQSESECTEQGSMVCNFASPVHLSAVNTIYPETPHLVTNSSFPPLISAVNPLHPTPHHTVPDTAVSSVHVAHEANAAVTPGDVNTLPSDLPTTPVPFPWQPSFSMAVLMHVAAEDKQTLSGVTSLVAAQCDGIFASTGGWAHPLTTPGLDYIWDLLPLADPNTFNHLAMLQHAATELKALAEVEHISKQCSPPNPLGLSAPSLGLLLDIAVEIQRPIDASGLGLMLEAATSMRAMPAHDHLKRTLTTAMSHPYLPNPCLPTQPLSPHRHTSNPVLTILKARR